MRLYDSNLNTDTGIPNVDFWVIRFVSSVNPPQVNTPILYPLKTPENQTFSSVFRGMNGKIGRNALTKKNNKKKKKKETSWLQLGYLKQNKIYGEQKSISHLFKSRKMPFGYFECLLMCCTALVLHARVKQVPSKDKTDFTKMSGCS